MFFYFFKFNNNLKGYIWILSNKQTKNKLMKTLTDFDFKKKNNNTFDFNVLDENLMWPMLLELKRQNLQSMLS
jgi:hypothetical protein